MDQPTATVLAAAITVLGIIGAAVINGIVTNRGARAAMKSADAAMINALKGDVTSDGLSGRVRSPPVASATGVVKKSFIQAFYALPQFIVGIVGAYRLSWHVALVFLVIMASLIDETTDDDDVLVTLVQPRPPAVAQSEEPEMPALSTAAISWEPAPAAWVPWPASTRSRSGTGNAESTSRSKRFQTDR
jgi:hypothetical protein